MTILKGPTFEPKISGFWRSKHDRDGMHYNIFELKRNQDGMAALVEIFPDAKADKLNFCLFSTSGIHGTYNTIEEAEKALQGNRDHIREVTFLVVHPRTVTLRYGVVNVENQQDIEYLKALRASSWEAMLSVGRLT